MDALRAKIDNRPMPEQQLRRRLSKLLQLHGYSACQESLVLLEDHYSTSVRYESLDSFISQLNKVITFETTAESSIIDPDLAHLVIQKLKAANSDKQQVVESDPSTETPDAASQSNNEPPLASELAIKVKNVQLTKVESRPVASHGQQQEPVYHPHFSPFVIPTKQQTTPIIVADKPAADFNIHYNFFFKKLSSMPIFRDDFQLTKLETLTRSSQPSIRCICFGLVIKDISKIDGYMLVDSSGRVPFKITPDTTFRNRLAYLNCLVIVEGVYTNPDDVLFAANIGYPPMLLDPIVDKSLCCRDDRIVVFLHEIYLDEPDVIKALELLFTGYDSSDEPPIMFVLIGDFTREACKLAEELTAHLKKLSRIISACNNLKDSHILLVPGARDSKIIQPSLGDTTMPKPSFTQDIFPLNNLKLHNFNNIHLTTNPTHIHFGERLISVVAHSYIKELRKSLLHDLSDHREELFETAKQIILSNGHLTAGTSKSFRNSMKLWHKPDLLVLADTEAFGRKYDYSLSKSDDTSFATLSSFSRQSFHFKVYYLRSGELEESQASIDE